MKHYTIDELDRYIHGKMSTLSKIKCASHLKSCSECRVLISQLENDDILINKLKDALDEFDDSEDSNENEAYKKLATILNRK